jgi:hypothetical protein
MNEPTDKEKAHAALKTLASDAPLTQAERNKLCDDVHWYIYDLELQALQHSGEAVVNEPTFIDLTLEEIEGIIKSNITITDYRLYDGVYAVATDIETALKNKNSSAGKGGEE